MRRTKTVDICFFNGSSRKSRKELFVFCRLFFLAQISLLYSLPDGSENQDVIANSIFRTSPALSITLQDQTDLTDLFDDTPFSCNSNRRQQTLRRTSKSFSSAIAETPSGNRNVVIAVRSSVKYFFENSDNASCRCEKYFFVRAGPQISA